MRGNWLWNWVIASKNSAQPVRRALIFLNFFRILEWGQNFGLFASENGFWTRKLLMKPSPSLEIKEKSCWTFVLKKLFLWKINFMKFFLHFQSIKSEEKRSALEYFQNKKFAKRNVNFPQFSGDFSITRTVLSTYSSKIYVQDRLFVANNRSTTTAPILRHTKGFFLAFSLIWDGFGLQYEQLIDFFLQFLWNILQLMPTESALEDAAELTFSTVKVEYNKQFIGRIRGSAEFPPNSR